MKMITTIELREIRDDRFPTLIQAYADLDHALSGTTLWERLSIEIDADIYSVVEQIATDDTLSPGHIEAITGLLAAVRNQTTFTYNPPISDDNIDEAMRGD